MIFELALFLSLMANTLANEENQLIVDYFQYKNAPSVVGFSCNDRKDDLSLAKKFSKIGVTTSFRKLDPRHPINSLASTEYRKLGVFLDLRCYDTGIIVSTFSQAAAHWMYDELHQWLVLGSSVDEVASIVNDNAYGYYTDFVIAVPFANNTQTYQLYDAYNAWKVRGAKLNVTFLGSWSMDRRLNITLNETKFKRRANLHGMVVRAAFFWSKFKPPNVSLEEYLKDYTSSNRDAVSKFGFSMVTHLSELLNFKIQCKVAKWEVGDATGPIIRALYNNEIDLSGTPPTMSIKRTYLVKYMVQSWPFRTCFIFRSPQPKDMKVNEVLGPLEMKVWYLTAVFFTLGVWVMASALRHETVESTIMRYSNSALVYVGAVCQQGTDVKMIHASTRIAFYFILIFNFLLYNYYSASIVTARLNEPIYKLNDSLNQLTKSNMKLASEWMVYFELFIKKQDWETKTFYTNRWMQIPESDQFMEPEKAMRLVQKGGFAYHVHPDVGYTYVNQFFENREICELTEIHLANPTFSTFAVSYNSTFTDMMRIGLTKISEVGLRNRQLSRWKAQKPHCLKTILSASSLNIYEFAPHLLILIFGMILAIVVCIVEMAWVGHNHRLPKLLLKAGTRK